MSAIRKTRTLRSQWFPNEIFFPLLAELVRHSQPAKPHFRASAFLTPFPKAPESPNHNRIIVLDTCRCRVVSAHRPLRALHYTHANLISCKASPSKPEISAPDSRPVPLPILAAAFRSARFCKPSSSCRPTTSLRNGLRRDRPAGTTRRRRRRPAPVRASRHSTRFAACQLTVHLSTGASSVIPREESAAFTHQLEGM